MNVIGRKPTLFFVAVLCVGQFVWTCNVERAGLGVLGITLSVGVVALCLLGFERLRALGALLVGEAKAKKFARDTAENENSFEVPFAAEGSCEIR